MKPCILLIEDDSDMRELVAGHLEHGGFDVHGSARGKLAERQAGRHG